MNVAARGGVFGGSAESARAAGFIRRGVARGGVFGGSAGSAGSIRRGGLNPPGSSGARPGLAEFIRRGAAERNRLWVYRDALSDRSIGGPS